ncbi:hypothetical protein B0A54_06533 [Friedmanniomyces endolithicus]|uniref:Uncharacterized protein n=1 Tax=Friedmanniomyces endolithicus TaxID=329885 RepID=A0A4U0V202_9PEZI|nr:hypothetical protein B0A54_06533 [Friedmanniomyces endolithicus]
MPLLWTKNWGTKHVGGGVTVDKHGIRNTFLSVSGGGWWQGMEGSLEGCEEQARGMRRLIWDEMGVVGIVIGVE